nr:reverse transcriptase domain-containing protein [Tanacetum cinerariifolium]
MQKVNILFARLLEEFRFALHRVRHEFENTTWPIMVRHESEKTTWSIMAPTEGYEDAIVVPAIIADNFKLKHAWIWLEKELPRSIFTWDDLVLKFINQFFPPSKTTNLRNEITNFQQLFDESFREAWDRFKDLLRACPHHGFLELYQLDTFYNAVNSKDQDSLNSAAGVVAKVSTNTSTSGISPDVAELKDMVKAILLNKNGQNQSPAPVKQSRKVTASTSSSGTLPSNTIANSGSDLKAFTTRSGVSYDGPQIPLPPSFLPKVVKNEPEATKDTVNPTNNESTEDVQPQVVQSKSPILTFEPVTSPISEPVIALVSAPKPNPKSLIPYPSKRNDERNREKANNQIEKFYQIFKDMSFEISFADALILMPKFASTLKALIGNKEKLSEMARTPLNEHCSVVILKKLLEKLGDPGKFLIPCDFPELADRSISRPIGVAEDVYVKVGSFSFLVDFVVVDFDADPRVPLILGRSFLKTGRAVIDVFEEYSQEVLGFSDVIASGNPTPYYDPIVSTTSLTLTQFENSDFLLEEVDAFLAIEDDPNSLKFYQPYLYPNGDILLLEAFLNDDPSLPPPNQGNYLPEVCKELKICKAKYDKTSIDEPLEVELKDLPSHLKYAFLEGTFQRCMMAIFHDMIEKTMELFMDDFSVFKNSFQSCLSHLERMLKSQSTPWFADLQTTMRGILLSRACRPSRKAKKPFKSLRLATMDPQEGIDFMGPFPSSKGNKYILVAVDYLSKWAEAKALPSNDARVVCKFLKNLFARFGTPRAIISDWGTHLCNDQFAKVMQKFDVTHRLATPYYPQTSGQVEVSNRGLKRILERAVGLHEVKGGARVAFKDEFRSSEEKKVLCEAQQGRSGVKRKLFRSFRNKMGNEPILALSEGSDNFVVMREARLRMGDVRTLIMEEAYLTKYHVHPGGNKGKRREKRLRVVRKWVRSLGLRQKRPMWFINKSLVKLQFGSLWFLGLGIIRKIRITRLAPGLLTFGIWLENDFDQ